MTRHSRRDEAHLPHRSPRSPSEDPDALFRAALTEAKSKTNRSQLKPRTSNPRVHGPIRTVICPPSPITAPASQGRATPVARRHRTVRLHPPRTRQQLRPVLAASAADATGKGFSATLCGAYSRIPGQLGQAVKLSPGGLIRTGAPVLNINQSYTVTAWVRLDIGVRDQAVFSQMGTNQPGFSLGCLAPNASPVPIGSKKLAGVGRWTRLAAQYDATAHKIRLYVDGELNAERDHTTGWNARGAFRIGRGTVIAGDEATLDGVVDDVHAYQRVLTGDEIRSLVGVPATTTHNNIPSGQTLDKVFTTSRRRRSPRTVPPFLTSGFRGEFRAS
ncbi:LamG domain-containing protein [Nonomuraea wenchangensis]|uniref:LamG domain-containing protein n=1 Tax=Nonomuraea wenchangensis TaxID=568860 RepID=UPI003792A4B4